MDKIDALLSRRGGHFERHAGFMRWVHETFWTGPDYELMLQRACRAVVYLGDTVIDVGAHGGRHTGPLSNLVGDAGTVLAFEPLSLLAAQLRASGWRGLKINAVALSPAARFRRKSIGRSVPTRRAAGWTAPSQTPA